MMTHQHFRGGLYREVCRATLEKNMEPVVVYEDVLGRRWVRPVKEFDDPNRFKPLKVEKHTGPLFEEQKRQREEDARQREASRNNAGWPGDL